MRRRREEPVNHEAWAIPYGDLLTLLLAFFVVMYAVSSVNEGKYRVLSDALNAEFRGAPRSLDPIQVGQVQRGDAELKNDVPPAEAEAKRAEAERVASATARTAADLERVAQGVESAMANLIRADLLSVRRNGLWVEVEIQTDILFGSGAVSLSPLAMGVLAQLADAVKPFNNPIRVEGHTDNVPIRNSAYPSNWELSAARAAKVVQLFTKHGVDPKRLTVIGMADNKPIQSNDTPEGRNANRRVVLVILGTDALPNDDFGVERDKNETPAGADAIGHVATAPAIEAAARKLKSVIGDE